MTMKRFTVDHSDLLLYGLGMGPNIWVKDP